MKNRGVRFEKASPDRILIQRFRNLCAALRDRKDEIEVRTFGDLELELRAASATASVTISGLDEASSSKNRSGGEPAALAIRIADCDVY